MAKAKKKAVKAETGNQPVTINDLAARVALLERKQKLVTEGYEFVANETRNLFGFGAIALIFDSIFERLNK